MKKNDQTSLNMRKSDVWLLVERENKRKGSRKEKKGAEISREVEGIKAN